MENDLTAEVLDHMMRAMENGVDVVTIEEDGSFTIRQKIYWYPDGSEE